jgi:hypothetical protein
MSVLRLKAQAAPVVIPRQGIFFASKFPRIRLRADWIVIILPLSAGLLAITGATEARRK